MLFDHDVRAPAEWELGYAGEDDEPARIREWQREQLMRIDVTLTAEPVRDWRLDVSPTPAAEQVARLNSWLDIG